MAGETGFAPGDLGVATGETEPPETEGPAVDVSMSDAQVRAPAALLAPERKHALDQLLSELEREPEQFDFFKILNRLEYLYHDSPDRPRFGSALRPADEPIRLGQEATMSFPPAALASFRRGHDGLPPRLLVHFFGLLGPHGPLPLHLTEYVRDRLRNSADATMGRFFDLFHHRLLMFFYRAWASVEPTASHERAQGNRFFSYVGSLLGVGMPSFLRRDEFPDAAKLFYAGRFSAQTRNAEGLGAVIGDFFKMPARIESFVGDWLDIPLPYRWRLGQKGAGNVGLLGLSTTLGARAWSRQQKFRVVLGPLSHGQFHRMLPGGASLGKLAALVRNYTGDEQRWDLRLFLQEQVEEPWHLGRSRLGWTSWPGRAEGARREDLILDPQMETYRAA